MVDTTLDATAGSMGRCSVTFDSYLVRRKILKLVGGAFHIYDPSGNVAFFSELKAFKLKEDIRIYADESKASEVLNIKARQVLDISATYDITDALSGENVGALRRAGLKSTFVVDEWAILDATGNQIGTIKEDNWVLGLLRRLVLGSLVPQSYDVKIGEQLVAEMKQNFNPFVNKIGITFQPGAAFDRRIGIAAAILINAIEGKQN